MEFILKEAGSQTLQPGLPPNVPPPPGSPPPGMPPLPGSNPPGGMPPMPPPSLGGGGGGMGGPGMQPPMGGMEGMPGQQATPQPSKVYVPSNVWTVLEKLVKGEKIGVEGETGTTSSNMVKAPQQQQPSPQQQQSNQPLPTGITQQQNLPVA